MVGKIRLGRYAPGVLLAMLACTPRSAEKPTPPPPRPEVVGASQPLTPVAVVPGEAPHLQLQLSAMAEHTGGEFGLSVPMLQVVVRNLGAQPAAVPPPGMDMLLSLQVVLRGPAGSERRRVTLGKPWTIDLQPLAPQAEVHQGLSPLSREQRDVPLAPGHYQVSVCVIPDGEATYRSAFTEKLGGTCSSEIELVVRRGK